jgi:ATP/maltotriose-dependent transcriptional regulator MalT
MTGGVELGRDAFDRRAWARARTLLAAADSLDAADLQRLAVAAHLVGRDAESSLAWERAQRACERAGDLDGAARCAFWLALLLLLRGEVARAGGWLARAERLVAEADRDCAAASFLLVPVFLEALVAGDVSQAEALASDILREARRFDDPDLLAFGLLCQGQAAIARGDTGRGMRLLDEVMLGVTAGEVSPIPTGIVYCAVIESCLDVFDLRRAAEWTEALNGWCTGQPDLVPYRGQCLVHRAQILQAHGAWNEAVTEAERARLILSDPVHPALGLALYQLGELYRLRGEPADAERAYRAALEHGREPAPGMALIRLAEGKVAAAAAAVRRMLQESGVPATECAVRAAAVEILLAAGDLTGARTAADELVRTADRVGAHLLHAMADAALGAVLLAQDDVTGALVVLRRACGRWRALEMPYDEALARVRIAQACRALADSDTASLELDAARVTFERLGARPDLVRVARLAGREPRPTVLTERECEVLRLVAAGRSNREIAAALVISTHTVARHVQNIFAKAGLSSRVAATAYAYEHDLL